MEKASSICNNMELKREGDKMTLHTSKRNEFKTKERTFALSGRGERKPRERQTSGLFPDRDS